MADYNLSYTAEDINTRLDIQDNLTSTYSDKPLSANQGKVLNDCLVTGWTPSTVILTYASADSPTFVASTSIDLTGSISVGYRVKLTQTTVKYFIVTAITSTTITLYGGTDYTLTNATITDVYYSNVKAPLAFPLNPDKWSVVVRNSQALSQSIPSANVWYNVGSLNIVIPIGIWRLSYQADSYSTSGTLTDCLSYTTLSTANNTQTNSDLTSRALAYGTTVVSTACAETNVALSAKTTFYLNIMTPPGGVTGLGRNGNAKPTIIKAVCAYL